VTSIKHIRQLLFVFYKLKLPYGSKSNDKVLDGFIETEKNITPFDALFGEIAKLVDGNPKGYDQVKPDRYSKVIRKARKYLAKVFSGFDPREILPRHGPGTVSTKETLWGKYRFRRINPRIQLLYPFDAYFCASLGQVVDECRDFSTLESKESSARVLLVPKDSRGPRLISCEPLENQWVQQGLSEAIVRRVEQHPLTRDAVHFTDQEYNQRAALYGSYLGSYSTLDLKDASDRVTLGLVRLLFPEPLFEALEACRSLSTVLPNGETLILKKYAPMGSALCFPVMALTIWSILAASSTDADARKSILVYGDDVVVRADQTANAIATLESFGLAINRDKSCCQGFFRESCGVDAYKGTDVTPIRIRTTWRHTIAPDVYTSYIEYSNNFYEQGYYETSKLIAGWIYSFRMNTPTKDMGIPVPSLYVYPEVNRPLRKRGNRSLQRLEYLVTDVVSRPINKKYLGWSSLLRYFTEGRRGHSASRTNDEPRGCGVRASDCVFDAIMPFSVGQYTRRNSSYLENRWREQRIID
jgi:hypothetical protein